MDFVFELLLEIIMEPIVEGYAFLMTRFFDKGKKVDKRRIKGFIVFECFVLILLFIVGCIMLFETNGSSSWGKAVFLFPIAVSVIQITAGGVLRKNTKGK